MYVNWMMTGVVDLVGCGFLHDSHLFVLAQTTGGMRTIEKGCQTDTCRSLIHFYSVLGINHRVFWVL
jgi:hypothetical protein